jgi:aldehyde dehydrogenase (NAD+)
MTFPKHAFFLHFQLFSCSTKIHARVVETFASEKTLSYTYRIAQLKALRRAIEQNQDKLIKAAHADLRKNPHEFIMTEINPLMSEINVAIRDLKKWMQPRSSSGGVVFALDTIEITPQPRGAVLVIGAWNYNLEVLLFFFLFSNYFSSFPSFH